MRTAGQARLGFYPTPDRVMEFLKAWIAPPPEPWSLLDPCCGEGAARLLRASFTYGIEMEATRAQATRDTGAFAEVLTSPMEWARVPQKSVSALYLNPPYDNGIDGRMELDFLRRATLWLQSDGLLLYVVPQTVVHGILAHYVAQRYTLIGAWRFPDPEYADYGQVVIVARKRATPVAVGASGLAVTEAVKNAPALNWPQSADARWPVPPGAPIHLRGAEWEPSELLDDLTTAQGGGWTSVFQNAVRNSLVESAITTPLTLHRGH